MQKPFLSIITGLIFGFVLIAWLNFHMNNFHRRGVISATLDSMQEQLDVKNG